MSVWVCACRYACKQFRHSSALSNFGRHFFRARPRMYVLCVLPICTRAKIRFLYTWLDMRVGKYTYHIHANPFPSAVFVIVHFVSLCWMPMQLGCHDLLRFTDHHQPKTEHKFIGSISPSSIHIAHHQHHKHHHCRQPKICVRRRIKTKSHCSYSCMKYSKLVMWQTFLEFTIYTIICAMCLYISAWNVWTSEQEK